MKRYVQQLLSDIRFATVNVSLPFADKGPFEISDWISDEEEDRTAPIRMLNEWSGIDKTMLPPETMLNDAQVKRLLEALKNLLDAYNCSFVLQTEVPERLQYESIRQNFNQQVKVKRWHMGFFALCAEGTERGKCALGEEHCQCLFYDELLAGFTDDEGTIENSFDNPISDDDDKWSYRNDFSWDDDDDW